ncbi:MAG: RNA-binding cell elongation regulator Jag/EloR [Chloroflexota bacterium]|nr:RNA-binding cell elongation regulator Jag/EloR [Chloroflexota bacterium]
MEEGLEISGKTVEEAIQHALDELGVSREQLEITVLKEGRHGVLGLGAEEATIRVRRLTPEMADVAQTVKKVIETLLDKMGLQGSVEPQVSPAADAGEETTAPIAFDIKGDDLGILIGRGGHTLSCLQYIVRLIVAHQTNTWVPIVIDVEGYKARRYEALQALAERIADQVKSRRLPFTLKPMPAYERRIIHLTLADHPDVFTESTGMGEARRVVINPVEKK